MSIYLQVEKDALAFYFILIILSIKKLNYTGIELRPLEVRSICSNHDTKGGSCLPGLAT